MPTRPAKDAAHAAPETPLLEWIMAAIGLALVVGLMAYLVWDGVQTRPGEPRLVVEATNVTPQDNRYLVEVEVRNLSRVTAAEVEVRGEVPRPGGAPETVSLALDFVPALGERQGSMSFAQDPRARGLSLAVVGQVTP